MNKSYSLTLVGDLLGELVVHVSRVWHTFPSVVFKYTPSLQVEDVTVLSLTQFIETMEDSDVYRSSAFITNAALPLNPTNLFPSSVNIELEPSFLDCHEMNDENVYGFGSTSNKPLLSNTLSINFVSPACIPNNNPLLSLKIQLSKVILFLVSTVVYTIIGILLLVAGISVCPLLQVEHKYIVCVVCMCIEIRERIGA